MLKEVRELARAASLCRWSTRDKASSVANHFAPTLIGVSTDSFEACLAFTKANGELASDELMGFAAPPSPSICNDKQQNMKWKAFAQEYTYDNADAAGWANYSTEICAHHPLAANKASADDALRYLLLGADYCNRDVVEKAIALGADPNAPGKQDASPSTHRGKYALELVLEQIDKPIFARRCVDTAKLMLKKGANPKALEGDNALHKAVNGPADLIAALIDAGADPKARLKGGAPKITIEDYDAASRVDVGQTPLMTFIRSRADTIENKSRYSEQEFNDSMQVLNLLIHRSDVDAQDWIGRTALMLAVEAKANKTAQLLLQAGANKTLKDQFGRTALAYSKLAKNQAIQGLLTKK